VGQLPPSPARTFASLMIEAPRFLMIVSTRIARRSIARTGGGISCGHALAAI
jgi:hypothetical protein